MSLGRLLATGKSLVGLRGGESRYRTDKNARLPKFASPKNPFAPAEVAVEPPVTAPGPMPSATAKPVATEKKTLRAPARAAKATGWLSEWGRKLNPLSRGPKPAGLVKSLAPLPGMPPQQGELSLDAVKVMRNDLSDTDFEVVRPRAVRSVSPVMAMTAEKLEPVGAAWNRITTRFFGVDQP